MNTIIETITPKKAKDLLDRNTRNRPISNSRVRYYSSLMKQGKWRLTHQGLAISDTGIIIDGQHRLLAIIESNMPIDFNVTYGVNDDSFKYVDVGYTRTTANIFAIEDIPNYTKHSAGISRYHNIKDTLLFSQNDTKRTKNSYTHDDYLQFYYDKQELLRDIQSKSTSLYTKYKILKTSEIYSFMLYGILDAKWSYSKLESFFDHVYMIRHDAVSTAPRLLFDKLIQDATGTSQLKSKVKSALIIKTFNYFIQKRSVKILKYAEETESFPSVIINNQNKQ